MNDRPTTVELALMPLWLCQECRLLLRGSVATPGFASYGVVPESSTLSAQKFQSGMGFQTTQLLFQSDMPSSCNRCGVTESAALGFTMILAGNGKAAELFTKCLGTCACRLGLEFRVSAGRPNMSEPNKALKCCESVLKYPVASGVGVVARVSTSRLRAKIGLWQLYGSAS